MRRPLIAVTAAAVVGASALAVPTALAARSSPAAVSTSAAVPALRSAAPRALSVTTAVSTRARTHKKCSYPTNRPTLTLSPSFGHYRHAVKITFHGKLTLNSCAVRGERIKLLSSHGRRAVGADSTDARGFYSISVKVRRTTAFIAVSSGRHKKATFSNPSYITIRH